MSRARELLRGLARGPWSLLLVVALGLYLLWPVPSGVMPLSADHTVHLTRAWLYGQQLASGHVVGWSPHWFFGFPLGELYAPLGDLLVVGVRGASGGLLAWPAAYALALTLVFVLQGLVLLRFGRALGLGPLPGAVAACLALLDVGAYREGGWIYTLTYGVWPQALATSLAWLAFAELALAARAREGGGGPAARRGLVRAALAAAGALLAHSMSLPMFALGAALWLATVGLRGAGGEAPPGRRERLAAAGLDLGLGLGLGLGLAAWWLWPMSAHRGYMAAYGWLHAPLEYMVRLLREGQWAQLMAPVAGYAALLGLVGAVFSRGGVLRFVALWTLLHWLLAASDVFWGLRLDRLSPGFQHIQYQRFLTAAKPGVFLLAGALVGALWCVARRTWSQRRASRVLSIGAGAAALGLAAWLLGDAWAAARRHEVGQVQTERVPGDPEFARHYADLLAWLGDAWERRDADFRIAVRADRNAHWFMDAPVFSGVPLYKIGFTPGDNFVHKPESGDPGLLDQARVRYLVARGRPGPDTVASFGPLRVDERRGARPVARLEGPGALAIEAEGLAQGQVWVDVTGAGEGSRLVFHVAGYPRWELVRRSDAGEERVAWFEVPVLGQGRAATPEQRLRGELRGGKANGDDGSEPTLIAADVRDGSYELRYVRWRWFDVAGLLATLAAAAAALLLFLSERPRQRLLPLVRRLTHPGLLAALLVLGLGLAGARWRRAAAEERPRASAWLAEGRVAAATGVRSGPLKTDMTIVPALLADPRRPAEVVFPGVRLGPELEGWIALDDDDAKQRRRGGYRVELAARPAGAGAWTALAQVAVPHRPDRQPLAQIAVPSDMQAGADLRVTITPSGEAPPRLGLDLRLE